MRLPLQVRAAALRRGEDVAVQRVDDHADDRVAVDLGGDRHGEARVAVQVVGGAVDRVDRPSAPRWCPTSAVPSSPRIAVVGSRAADAARDERLGGPVHLGDHVGADRLGRRRSSGLVLEPVDEQRGSVAWRAVVASASSGGEVGAAATALLEPRPHRRLPYRAGMTERDADRRPALRHRHQAVRGDAAGDGRGRGRRRRLRRGPDRQPARGDLRRAGRQGGRGLRAVGDDGATRSRCGCSACPAPRSSPAAPARRRVRERRRGDERLGAVAHSSTTPRGSSPTPTCSWPIDLADHHQVPVERGVRREHAHGGSGTPWDVDPLDAIAEPRRPGAPRRRAALQRRGRDGRQCGAVRQHRDDGDVLPLEGSGRAGRVAARGSARPHRRARGERKRLGGAMRQAGVLAAPGLIALQRERRPARRGPRARARHRRGRREPMARCARSRARPHEPRRVRRRPDAAGAPRPPRSARGPRRHPRAGRRPPRHPPRPRRRRILIAQKAIASAP